MPQYDYQCTSCEHTFSKNLRMADNKLPESEPCPSCSSTNTVTQQILGAPSLGNPVTMGIRKHDSGFKEVMEKMHAGVPGSNLKNSNSSLF